MKNIIDHIKLADKRKLIIYLFSFFLFLVLNNLFSNLIFLSLDDHGLINYWGSHAIPCRLSPILYISLFQGLKLLLFILFLIICRRRSDQLTNEFFIAYLFYDLVFLLSKTLDILPLPIKAITMLSSNGQTFYDWYTTPDLSVIISTFWTLALLFVLRRQQKIKFAFFINRFAVILFSVPFISLSLIILGRLFLW